MSHFTATIAAFDMLDRVHVSAHVLDTDADGDSPDYQFHCAVTVPGSGESDNREWLRDALVALAETL